MLPVNSSSKLRAKDFVATINKADCIPTWMKKIFAADGNDLRIAKEYVFPKGARPDWFLRWQKAAYEAWEKDEWELTTGTLQAVSTKNSLMEADGVFMGKKDPDGRWTRMPLATADASGLTVPTEKMQRELNADKDKKLHYGGNIVKPQTTGKPRGALVVGYQMKMQNGSVYQMKPDEITLTLFHELYHAGEVSAGQPNADADPRFKRIADFLDVQFSHCTP